MPSDARMPSAAYRAPVSSIAALTIRCNVDIQVQVGTDLDDDPHQLFHLVMSRHQLVELGPRIVPVVVPHSCKSNC